MLSDGGPFCLLVIDGQRSGQGDAYKTDWRAAFGGRALADGRALSVEQSGWDEFLLASDPPADPHAAGAGGLLRPRPALVHFVGRKSSGPARAAQTFRPRFVLIREECYTCAADHRNLLYGLMHSGAVGAVNSLQSVLCFLERPVVHGELVRVAAGLAAERRRAELAAAPAAAAGGLRGPADEPAPEAIPVVPQCYFSSHREMMYGGSFPCVAKVGHAHAGMGKMRVRDHHDMEDFRSVLAMTKGAYCTAEPFLGEAGAERGVRGSRGAAPETFSFAFDLRIQKIGACTRVFRRISVSGNWKTNVGSSFLEEVSGSVSASRLARYRAWARAASEQMFGGLDICTVDALCRGVVLESEWQRYLHSVVAKSAGAGGAGASLEVLDNPEAFLEKCAGSTLHEYVLEVNGTSSGLSPEYEAEDNLAIRDLVLQRVDEMNDRL